MVVHQGRVAGGSQSDRPSSLRARSELLYGDNTSVLSAFDRKTEREQYRPESKVSSTEALHEEALALRIICMHSLNELE